MNIKKLIKPVSALSAAAVILTASGCADTSWSFKTDETTLTNGNWILYTYNKYEEAMSKINTENSENSVSEESIDINSSKVEDKNAVDWIYDEAKEACIAQLTVEKLIKDNKVNIDESEMDYMESMYKNYYFQMSSALNEMGVSKETFMNVYVRYPYLYQQLFTALYGKGGSKEVKDDELKEYFIENYSDYFYIPYSLTTTDEDGKTVDVDDNTKDKVKTSFAKYADMLNKDGKTTNDVVEEYKTDFEVTTDPSQSNVMKTDDISMDEELKKAYDELSEKSATVKTIDNTTYLIYKGSIKEDAERINDDVTEDSISRSTILSSMKNKEYEDYMKGEQKKLSYDSNENCLSKYSVQRVIDIINKLQSGN